MAYNPFTRPGRFAPMPEDLHSLVTRKIAEGWSCEFKREIPKPDSAAKVARSIAAFANSDGGWYFVGVEEAKDPDYPNRKTGVAGTIVGMVPESLPNQDLKRWVADAVGGHVDPLPLFFPHIIDVGEGRVVLAVWVPGDQETPYIADGAIYRRNNDASEPVREPQRSAIDRLVDRGRDASGRFRRFCTDARSLPSHHEVDYPEPARIELYFSPHPLGLVDVPDLVSKATIVRLRSHRVFASGPASGNAKTLFDWGQPSSGSLILRQRQLGDPDHPFNGRMVELFADGRAKFFSAVPLSTGLDFESLGIGRALDARYALDELGKQFPPGTSSLQPRLLPLTELWRTLIGFTSFYLSWLGDQAADLELRSAFRLTGVWRVVPFLDLREWANHCGDFGFPFAFADRIEVPDGIGNGLRLALGEAMPIGDRLCLHASDALGFPSEVAAPILSSFSGAE